MWRNQFATLVFLEIVSENLSNPPFHGHPIGIDIGLESFLATSDGQLIPRPKFFNSLHRKLKLLQRRLRFKKLGSNQRKKLNSKIARLHQKISDTRKDFHSLPKLIKTILLKSALTVERIQERKL
jgi:transposase